MMTGAVIDDEQVPAGVFDAHPALAKALSMNAKSGNHFCEKIMLKPLNLREFFSTR